MFYMDYMRKEKQLNVSGNICYLDEKLTHQKNRGSDNLR